MPKFFVENSQIYEQEITILGEDVNHIKNVLRKKYEDELFICNNMTGQDFRCLIERIEDRKIVCKILEEIKNNVEPKVEVTIFQSLPKSDKMELIIQKSVELGVYNIVPVSLKRCVVKLDSKKEAKKIERWQKISEVASKQSGRNRIPNISNVKNIKEIVNCMNEYDLFLVAYENEKENSLKHELEIIKKIDDKNIKIGVLIGPEGGIDEEEIETFRENGAKIITLGKRIMRTETVSINVLSILMYELDN